MGTPVFKNEITRFRSAEPFFSKRGNTLAPGLLWDFLYWSTKIARSFVDCFKSIFCRKKSIFCREKFILRREKFAENCQFLDPGHELPDSWEQVAQPCPLCSPVPLHPFCTPLQGRPAGKARGGANFFENSAQNLKKEGARTEKIAAPPLKKMRAPPKE